MIDTFILRIDFYLLGIFSFLKIFNLLFSSNQEGSFLLFEAFYTNLIDGYKVVVLIYSKEWALQNFDTQKKTKSNAR